MDRPTLRTELCGLYLGAGILSHRMNGLVASLLVALAAIAILLAGCAGNDRMSVAEFVAQCGQGDYDFDNFDETSTWGEFTAELRKADARYESFADRVPAELETWFSESRRAIVGLLAFTEERDADLPILATALSDGPILTELVEGYDQRINAAVAALSTETRAALVAAGCAEEDD